MRILIADDDYANRRFLEKVLASYGDVEVVQDGMSAVDIATKAMQEGNPFSLMCLDIMMTNLDGYKTLEAIREAETKYKLLLDKRAVVLMVSALDEVSLKTIHVCNDYDAYICKPIMMDKFEELLSKLGFQKKN